MVHEVLELEEDMELRQEYYMGHTMKHVGDPKEEAGLKVSKNELNMLKDVEELKPQKKLEVEVSEDLDLNKVKNAEEWKPEKAAELKVSKVLDLNKVKNAEELKPEKAAELKVSKVLDLNKVKNAEELKPEKAAELKVSKVLDLNKVKNIEEQKPEKAADLNMSKVLDLNPVDDVKELKPETETVLKMSKDLELKIVKSVEELKPEKETELKISKDMELETVKNVEELKPENETELKMSKDWEWRTVKNVEELKPEKEAELIVSKSIEEVKLLKAIEEMKLKLDGLESKLNESGVTISKLTEERMLSSQETKILQEKLVSLGITFQWEAGIRSGVRRNSTPICASTTAEWVEEKVFEMVKAKELGADLVEARLDFLKDFHPAQHHQSLINNRGESDGDESQRQDALRQAIELGSEFVDDDRAKGKKPESVKIIVSSHNLERTPSVEEIGNLAARIQASGADVIGVGTKVHGAVGNPISDSKSPHLYNATFKSVGFDGVYLPLLVDNVSDFLNTYSSPDFVGYNYTIPPKENGLRCCDEIDPIAKILRKDYTRFQFIHRSLLQLFADSNRRSISGCSPLCGKLFVVMGAGGAGKAIAYGGKEKGARVVVANRIYAKAKELVTKVGGEAITISELESFHTKGLV
ncbi:hypothetical protein JHK82_028303 [Glycine max]|nr:hypothetical protein JHK82_028303 [Glycine max]